MYVVQVLLKSGAFTKVDCETDEKRLECLNVIRDSIASNLAWVIFREYWMVRVSEIAAVSWNDKEPLKHGEW